MTDSEFWMNTYGEDLAEFTVVIVCRLSVYTLQVTDTDWLTAAWKVGKLKVCRIQENLI